jgi:hypothetical protein
MKKSAIMPMKKLLLKNEKEMQGASPPAFFVGRYGYPKVSVGPMIPPHEANLDENISLLDEPDDWFGKSVDEIINYRTNLIRSTFKIPHVKNILINNRLLDISQEIVMSEKPVDTEVKFIKAPRVARIELDAHSQPFGHHNFLTDI